MNIAMLAEMALSIAADRVVITDDDRMVTGAELGELAGLGADRLVADGHRCLVHASTHGTTFAVALLAAAVAGVPLVPVNYRLSDAELAGLVANHEDGLVIAEDPGRLASIGATVTAPGSWMAELAADRGNGAEGTPLAAAPQDPERPAVLLYTSGTTSAPKAVVLRHRHLTSYVLGTVELGAAGDDEAALVAVPPYHVAGVANLVTNLYAGRRMVVLGTFTAEGWLAHARAEAVTHALVVPTMLARIVDHLDGAPARVPSLRTLAYGGARTPPGVLEAALEAFGDEVGFVHAYGLTETSSTIAVLGPEDHRAASSDPAARHRLASVGRVIPGVEVSVRGPDGAEVGAGEPGRVWLRGEQVSGEYAGTGSALDAEGWFDTRDRGHLDADGYLFIAGRDDDTIIRGGENIAPAEIEDVVLGHPEVADVAVVGLADEEWGQRIAAAVVAVDGARPSPEDLVAWLRERLRGSRTPEVIERWDQLPRTDNGKLIRARVAEGLGGAPDPAAPG